MIILLARKEQTCLQRSATVEDHCGNKEDIFSNDNIDRSDTRQVETCLKDFATVCIS